MEIKQDELLMESKDNTLQANSFNSFPAETHHSHTIPPHQSSHYDIEYSTPAEMVATYLYRYPSTQCVNPQMKRKVLKTKININYSLEHRGKRIIYR